MDSMKLRVEFFRDEEVGQWGYSVPALSIVGTGCRNREEAEEFVIEAIKFVLEDEGRGAEAAGQETGVTTFEVELTRVSAASA
jgi:hypothetical protein